MPRSAEQFQTIHTEGAILPPDVLQRIATGELEGLDAATYHLATGTKTKEAISQSWTRLLRYWKDFQAARKLILESDETGTLATREKWLLPLFQELGYGRLTTSKAPEIDGKLFPIERFWQHIPIHLIGCKLQLDHRTKGARGAATAIPHSMVQEFLNRSAEHAWAFLSNGLQLRVLRDSAALSRQSFVEFDLESMMEGEVYADFAILWLVCHQSRLEGDKPEDIWLEKWSKLAQEQGTRILEDLRGGVAKAIESLGRGFISHPRNATLINRLQSGSLTTQDYYRQVLRIVYRLLFLFVAEDRGLLHPPTPSDESLRLAHDAARDLYDRFYSLRRLRDLAESYRGSKHADLWHSLSLLFDALGKPEGCPQLALPAFGSFLWSHAAAPDLSGPSQLGVASSHAPAFIRNEDLLDAVRALAFVERNRVLRAVNYRNLGSVELGSVYESLLELHPQINIPGRSFGLNLAAGNERKTTGSFYTPDSLVQCLLDSALEPVVADAIKGKIGIKAEKAILSLKICDAAVGSGHFLIAAAHRLARHLARVRTGEFEPSPQDYQHALRDVIGHCLYGVDLNPMAVELCKISLWMEALDPGKPLGFLDHRILEGNSLVGTTPALLSRGIPDEAFEPIEGDDKVYCRTFKKQNKDERKGQGMLFGQRPPWEQLGNLATSITQIDALPDDSVAAIRTKEERYADLVKSNSYESGRLLADAWCASLVWKKNKDFDFPITEKVFRDIERNPHSIPPWMKQELLRLRDQHSFFHWHLAFPDVFTPITDAEKDDRTGWTGGFALVLGNPPWEQVKLEEKEWFATKVPAIALVKRAHDRKQLIKQLQSAEPLLFAEFLEAKRHAAAISHFARNSGVYPLTSKGDQNTYGLFAELARSIYSSTGRVGIIIPAGVVADISYSGFFNSLVDSSELVSVTGFINSRKIFADVKDYIKFACVVLGTSKTPTFRFLLTSADQINELDRAFTLSQDEFRLLNPNTRTCPSFQFARDADIVKHVYRNSRVLIDRADQCNPWDAAFLRMFDMTLDSELFLSEPSNSRLPLYEARFCWHFEHRFSSYENATPQNINEGNLPQLQPEILRDPSHFILAKYWVERKDISSRIGDDVNWFLCFRGIAPAGNERTAIFAVVPRSATANSAPLLILDKRIAMAKKLCLIAQLNSFAFDYITRQKISGPNLNFFIVEQLPVFPPESFDESTVSFAVPRVLELTYTAWDLEPFALECGFSGPPFRWDQDRRFVLRCELDAAFFHLCLSADASGAWKQAKSETAEDLERLKKSFPTPRDAVAYIMDTFPITKRKDEQKYNNDYRTKRVILAIYDAMAEATKCGQAYQTRLDPPPADPRVAHPAKPSTAAQVQRGKVVAYLTLLLHAWKKPVTRDALEPSLIFMLNDKLRAAVLGQQQSAENGTRTASGEIVKGLDGLLPALHTNGAIIVENVHGRQTIRLGANAGGIDSAPQADRQRAEEAVKATQALGEDRAMTYLDAIGEARYDIVHA